MVDFIVEFIFSVIVELVVWSDCIIDKFVDKLRHRG